MPQRCSTVRGPALCVSHIAISCFWIVIVGNALRAAPPDGLLRGHEGAVMMGLVTPDGGYAVTGSTDQTARLWNLADGQQSRVYAQHSGPLYCLAVSRDGRTLVTGAQDNTVRVWDLPLPYPVDTLSPLDKGINSLALHPDGRTLLAGAVDQKLALYPIDLLVSAENASSVPQLRSGHAENVLAVACRNDAALYASADETGKIVLWSPFLDEPQRVLQGHAGQVTHLEFHSNNQQLISAGDDGCLRVWQLIPAAPRVVATLTDEIVDMVLAQNQSAVVVQSNGGVKLINPSIDHVVAEYPQQAFGLSTAAVAPNSTWVALGGVNGQTAIVNFADGAPRGIVAGHSGPVTHVASHPDSVRLMTAGADGTIRLWQQPQAESLVEGHSAAIRGLVAPGNGQGFVTISDDQSTRIWDANGAPQRQLGNHEQPLTAIALRDDDAILATGDKSGTVSLWNPNDGSAQGVVAAHSGSVTALAFSTDRSLLLTAGADRLVRAWKLPLPPKKPAEGEAAVLPVWELTPQVNEPLLSLWRLSEDRGYAGLTAKGQLITRIGLDGQETSAISVPRPLMQLTVTRDGNTILGLDDQGQAHFWNAQDALDRSVSLGKDVKSIQLKSDGTEVLVADGQSRVRICDAATGMVREELPTSVPVTNAVWIGPDSRTVAAVGADQKLSVVRRSLLRLIVAPVAIAEPPQLARPILSLIASPDQQHVLAVRQGGRIEQWNLNEGTLVRQFESGDVEMRKAVLAPNGQWVVGVGGDDTIWIWQLGDGQLVRTFPVASGIQNVSVSQDNNRIATAHQDGHVRIWDLNSGLLLETMDGHTAAVVGVQFLNDSRTVVSASKDKTVRAGQTSVARVIQVSPQTLRGMASYNGGSNAITASDDGRILMTDVNSGNFSREFRVLLKEDNPPELAQDNATPQYEQLQPTAVATRNDNQRVAAGTQTGDVYIWNANNGDELFVTFTMNAPISALAFSSDNQKLAALAADGIVQIWGPSVPGMQPQRDWVLHQEISTGSPGTDVLFAQDNRSIWVSSSDGRITRWLYAAPGQVRQFNHGGPVYGVAVSGDGQTVVSCSTDQTVRVWDVTTGQQRFQLNGHEGAVHAVALNPDETYAISSGADGTLKLWDVVGGRLIRELIRYDDTMYSLAIHPEGKLIAAAGADRRVHLLDLTTGTEQRTLEGGTDYLHCVQFRPDGSRVLSYGYAGYLKEWNTADGKLMHDARHGRVGNYAAFSPDGRQVLLSNGDGTARLIQAP